ncbi:MAG: hypothetical protein RXR31_04535 [Thermoproteota archaeon]|jgi:hypothetical protein
MDKAVIEIINTFALIFLGAILLTSSFIMFYNFQNVNYSIFLKNYKEKVENILNEIYFYKKYYNSNISFEIYSEYLVLINVVNSTLIRISVASYSENVTSILPVIGGGIGYYFIFSYSNNEIKIFPINNTVAA